MPINYRLPVELFPVGERSCKPGAEQRRPQRAGRQRCRQLGQGLLHLPGRQVLELDRAELADRMIGKTPVILDGAGLPRRGSVVERVPGAIGERSPGTGCGISFGTSRSPPTVPQKRHAPHRPRRRMPPVGPGPRGGAGRGEPSPDTAWRSWRRQDGPTGVPVRAGVRRGLPGGERGRGPVRGAGRRRFGAGDA
jgi:hypothetical protein